MPSLKKKVLSLYFRTQCERQLHLHLYSDAERAALGMPPRQQARSGLGLVGRAGYDWQELKVGELRTVFGRGNVLESPPAAAGRPGQIPLDEALARVAPHQFIVEAAYDSKSSTGSLIYSCNMDPGVRLGFLQ